MAATSSRLAAPPDRAVSCERVFLTTDFRFDVTACTVPTLVLHGGADHSAVLELTGQPTADLLPDADLRVYPGAPHGLYGSE